MSSWPAILGALLLQATLAAAEPAPAPAPTATPALIDQHGQRLTGPVRLDGGALVLAQDRVELGRLIALDYPGPVPCWLDQGVVLADGDTIRGVVRGLGADGLDFTSDLGGAMPLALADVAAVVFAPVPLASVVPASTATPGVILTNGDHLAGLPTALADGRLGLDTGRRIIQLPIARVRMVILRPPTLRTDSHQAVRLANGDRWSGNLTALSQESFTLSRQAGVLTLPTRLLRSLWSEGGEVTPLSALAGSRISSTPQFDETATVAVDHERERWLMAGGRRCEHGLMIPASCTAAFDLGGAYAGFVCEVALGGPRGAAVARVVVDGATLFDSGLMAAADRPRPVSVRLGGAHELDLVVVPGPSSDTAGAAAVWAWPTLERSP